MNSNDKYVMIASSIPGYSYSKFVSEFRERVGGVDDTLKQRASNVLKRARDGAKPNSEYSKIIMNLFSEKIGNDPVLLKSVIEIMNSDSISPLSVFSKLKVKMKNVSDYLTDDTIESIENERYGFSFFRKILQHYDDDDFANKVLNKTLGKYVMYRKHSVMRGILKEYININDHKHGYVSGVYYQWSSNNYRKGIVKPNEVEIDLFFCGDYMQVYGAFVEPADERNPLGKLEIIDVRLCIDVPRIKRDIELEAENVYNDKNIGGKYYGLLSGISDEGFTLLAERVYVERVDELSYDPKRMVYEYLDDSEKLDYLRIEDLIDNSVDGMVLDASLGRLSRMYR